MAAALIYAALCVVAFAATWLWDRYGPGRVAFELSWDHGTENSFHARIDLVAFTLGMFGFVMLLKALNALAAFARSF